MRSTIDLFIWLAVAIGISITPATGASGAEQGSAKHELHQDSIQETEATRQTPRTPPQDGPAQRSFRAKLELPGTKNLASLSLAALGGSSVRAMLQWKSERDQSFTTLFSGSYDRLSGELKLVGRETLGTGKSPPIYDFTGRLDEGDGRIVAGVILRPLTGETLGTWSAKSLDESGQRLTSLAQDWFQPEPPRLQLLRSISDPLRTENRCLERRPFTEEPASLTESLDEQVRSIARLHAGYFTAVDLANANRQAGPAEIDRFRREMASYLIETAPLDIGDRLARARDSILGDDSAIASMFRGMRRANERALALATIRTAAQRRSRELLIPRPASAQLRPPLEAKFCVAPGSGNRPTVDAMVGVQFERTGPVQPWYFVMVEVDADQRTIDLAWEHRLGEWQLSRGLMGEQAFEDRVRADHAEYEKWKLGVTKMSLVPRSLTDDKVFVEIERASAVAGRVELRAYAVGADFACLLLQVTGPQIKSEIERMTFDPPPKRTEPTSKKSRKGDKR